MESKIKQLRRMEKINSAIELFKHESIFDHSVSSIAKILGVQRKSFYAYFKTYELMLAEIGLCLEKELVNFQNDVYQKITELELDPYERIMIYAHLLTKEILNRKSDKLKLAYQVNAFMVSLPECSEAYQNYSTEIKYVKAYIPLSKIINEYCKFKNLDDYEKNTQVIVDIFFQTLFIQNTLKKQNEEKIAYLDNLMYFLIHSL